jgi:CRISPR-associated protein Cas2
MVYDVNVKRVNKVLKLARKYLNWVQNSVLEGDITDAKFFKLKSELQKIINKEEDSVIFYTFRSKLYTSREVIGKEKGSLDFIL